MQGQANLWSPLAGQSTPLGLVREPVSKLRWRPTEEDINADLKALHTHAHTCIRVCMGTHTHENGTSHMQIICKILRVLITLLMGLSLCSPKFELDKGLTRLAEPYKVDTGPVKCCRHVDGSTRAESHVCIGSDTELTLWVSGPGFPLRSSGPRATVLSSSQSLPGAFLQSHCILHHKGHKGVSGQTALLSGLSHPDIPWDGRICGAQSGRAELRPAADRARGREGISAQHSEARGKGPSALP